MFMWSGSPTIYNLPPTYHLPPTIYLYHSIAQYGIAQHSIGSHWGKGLPIRQVQAGGAQQIKSLTNHLIILMAYNQITGLTQIIIRPLELVFLEGPFQQECRMGLMLMNPIRHSCRMGRGHSPTAPSNGNVEWDRRMGTPHFNVERGRWWWWWWWWWWFVKF